MLIKYSTINFFKTVYKNKAATVASFQVLKIIAQKKKP